MECILVIGANGQIGSELVEALGEKQGVDKIIAADLGAHSLFAAPHYEQLDVLDVKRLAELIDCHGVTQVCQLAALLSVRAEQMPLKAWTLNMNGLLNVLELARERSQTGKPLKVFWPSSIAAFGPHTPALDTPQLAVMDPVTMYGISKQTGERLCEYYFARFGVDVRSIRYPGIISHKAPPGGGITDYAIEMFHAAVDGERYVCYLGPESSLPMIYMQDAIRATIELMGAPVEQLRVHSAYNVASMSFSPRQLAEAIRQHLPRFEIDYQPDARQAIADSWPRSLDDSNARADWGWQARISMEQLTMDMLTHIGGRKSALDHAA